jgi:hypothetical protein
MKLLTAKTTRFDQIIEKCGVPEVHTLWQQPKSDRHFQMFLKNNRVMTIQATDAGSDFGVVGFVKRKGARYLIFPRSLKRFERNRIVGIKWDKV